MQSFLFVGVARFELATSCSQSRRDNRATLYPEKKLQIKNYELIALKPFYTKSRYRCKCKDL